MKKFFPFILSNFLLLFCGGAQAQIYSVLKKGTTVNQIFVPYNANHHIYGKTTSATITPHLTANGFSTQELAAIYYALGIWSQIITSPVAIDVQIEFATLNPDQIALSVPINSFANFQGTDPKYQTNTAYPAALANKLKGSDISPSTYDILIQLNSNISFYTGTDGNCPSNKYDLVTTIMHEMGHGLGGMVSSVRTSNQTNQVIYGVPIGTNTYPFSYDRSVVKISSPPTPNIALTSFPYSSSTNTNLESFAESNSLFFTGSAASQANGNSSPKLYAPTVFESGSSVSHLDGATFPNQLFKPVQNLGEAIHTPGALGVGILSDIGWDATLSMGIEDDIYINNYPNSTSPKSTVFNVGSSYGYEMTFVDEFPYGDWLVSRSWAIELDYEGGKYILQTGNTQVWQPTISSLPSGYMWIRNLDGKVKGRLVCSGTDNDNAVHTKSYDISVNYKPNPPFFQNQDVSASGSCNRMKLSFWSAGATSYNVSFREVVPGQLNSWYTHFESGSTFDYTYNNLYQNVNYEFQVEAINAYGGALSTTAFRAKCKSGIVVSPNPASGSTTIEASNVEFLIRTVSVSNVTQPEIILTEQYNPISNSVQIDVSPLPTGTYAVKAIDQNGVEEITEMFIKN